MKLFGYWRSSATYRVRIALNLKGISYQTVPVHLVKDGGEQHQPVFRSINPMEQVPVLQVQEGALLTQSIAILEYLEETHPNPPLLPTEPLARARVRAAVEIINSGVQPLHNLSVMQEMKRLGGDDVVFARSAIERGLAAVEDLHEKFGGGQYVVGKAMSFADVVLVPQIYAARRFQADTSRFPQLERIAQYLDGLEPFRLAHPQAQPDYSPG